ncbi:prevent-host-death family protein [Agrobacterium tumefaciens F2]|nr:prevent-host-death family protein [Agrobacterium tumefaciens F2]
MRLVPVTAAADKISRRATLAKVRATIANKADDGPNAARSQDFLYDEHGLPK